MESHLFFARVALLRRFIGGAGFEVTSHYHAEIRLAIKKCDFDENLWALAFLLDLFAPCGIM